MSTTIEEIKKQKDVDLTMSDFLAVIDEREQEEQKAKQMQLEDSVTELKQLSESQSLELKRAEDELTQARAQAQTLSADLIELNAAHEHELEDVKDRAEREAKSRADREVEAITSKNEEELDRVRREEQEKAKVMVEIEKAKNKTVNSVPAAAPEVRVVTVTQIFTQIEKEKIIEKVIESAAKKKGFLNAVPVLTAFDGSYVVKKDSVLDKIPRKLSMGKGTDKS